MTTNSNPEPLQLMSPQMARFCDGIMALADHTHLLCKFYNDMTPRERSALCRVDVLAITKLSQETGISARTIDRLVWANYRGMKKAGLY